MTAMQNQFPQVVFRVEDIPRAAIAGEYDLVMVAGSFIIAAISAYISLVLVSRIHQTADKAIRHHLLLAATASLACGVWSMHFVGMLALQMPHEAQYHAGLTVVSLLVVTGAVYFSLKRLSRARPNNRTILVCGLISGLGIVLMHYIGMAAMQMAALTAYRFDLLIASVLIAVVSATVSFWLGLRFFGRPGRRYRYIGVTAALLMGVAISGMHYVGMAAAIMVPHELAESEGIILDSGMVTYLIIALMAIVFSVSSLIAATDARLSNRSRLWLACLLLAAVGVISGGTALLVIYDASFDLEQERLTEGVSMQAQLINAIAKYNKTTTPGTNDALRRATMAQIRDTHSGWDGFGRTGEIYLVGSSAGSVDFLIEPRLFAQSDPEKLSLVGTADVITQRAIAGLSGTTVARDYRGQRVLAGYGPVSGLDAGLVIKLDLDEFRQPFLEAATGVLIGTLVLIGLGLWLVRDISAPIIEELRDKQRLELELDFARQVQEGLLPDEAPSLHGYELSAKSTPARFVGGDFYDFRMQSPTKTMAIIGDISGKGVSAALHMARLIGDFRHACESENNPDQVLRVLNRRLYESAKQGTFATAVCFLLDAQTNQVIVSNAGHHSPLLRSRTNHVQEISPPSGPPLGILEDSAYQCNAIEVAPDETVLLFTDGVVEARDEQGNEFGTPRLMELLALERVHPEQLVSKVDSTVRRFTANRVPFDDSTLMALGRS